MRVFIRTNWATWSNPTKWSGKKRVEDNTHILAKIRTGMLEILIRLIVLSSEALGREKIWGKGSWMQGGRDGRGSKDPAAWGIPCRAQRTWALERATGAKPGRSLQGFVLYLRTCFVPMTGILKPSPGGRWRHLSTLLFFCWRSLGKQRRYLSSAQSRLLWFAELTVTSSE